MASIRVKARVHVSKHGRLLVAVFEDEGSSSASILLSARTAFAHLSDAQGQVNVFLTDIREERLQWY